MINLELIKTFEGGYSTDLKDNLEKSNTFQKGVNGCLYSKNGVVSFEFRKGTKLIYKNNNIVKYLGYHSFHDEIIVFAKCLKKTNTITKEDNFQVYSLSSYSFDITVSNQPLQNIDFSSEFSDNYEEKQVVQKVFVEEDNSINFNTKYSCVGEEAQQIDFGEYFEESSNVPNYMACPIALDNIPIHNETYYDCILSLKPNEENQLEGEMLWVGMQNWPLNAKITSEGVEENEFYKRVYYTDGFNPRRVMNRKDPSLIFRKGNEFDQILNNILLQPEITSIETGGQLNAMKVLYTYRVVSENGQLSEFSPTSFFADIITEDEPVLFRGGAPGENTGRYVTLKCNIMNFEPSSEIECIALEFEAYGVPTAIRNLGKKKANSVVEFKHYGNESEFIDNITFGDIIDFKNTWKYCNDFTSKKNKLIAGGLRNAPLPTDINNLEYLFPLHSWDIDGLTHDCLMNPKPWRYRYVDPSNTDKLIYVKQKSYRTLSSFGPLTIELLNKETDESINLVLSDLSIRNYTNILPDVINWLLYESNNNQNFASYFPNLDIKTVSNQLLFTPLDTNIATDMSKYVFKSNNEQFLENFENDVQFLETTVNQGNLVYGAQSIGFNEGVGVRVSYREIQQPLLEQAEAPFEGNGKILDYKKPSDKKFFMKGEIYRLAFQAYDKDSTRYFSIPLGDVMIPNIGELKKGIDDNGNAFFTSKKYSNQEVFLDTLYGNGIQMHVEVRLSCELKKLIPMYQLVYVERTEENRTILCQGISAPLNRVQSRNIEKLELPPNLRNKWTLPYFGGPSYEKIGLQNYDDYGEDYVTDESGWEKRIMQSRSLMYFDSPDLYFNKISSKYLRNSQINIVGKLNTDHTPGLIMNRGGYNPAGFLGYEFNEEYPKFSRKITEKQILYNNLEDLPKTKEETIHSFFINVSVFSNFQHYNKTLKIKRTASLKRGELISGAALGIGNDVSNNAFVTPCPSWYYGKYQRMHHTQNDRGPNSEIFGAGKTSPGYPTEIIKTEEDLFTKEFIGPDVHTVRSEIRLGGAPDVVYDTIPLINIFKNNRDFVYGGRTEEAFSLNTYIPLSRTIPVQKENNGTQHFNVGADTYVTLVIRTKNDFSDEEVRERDLNNAGGANGKHDIDTWERKGAWNYVVVLETQVEPKYTHEYEFYRESGEMNFSALRTELINNAYFNENILKSYVPKPFKFRDDPNQGNVVAVSDVKVAGEYYDSWTRFLPNNFYAELEKNKGDISNLVKEGDDVIAIQTRQTSLLYIGVDRVIMDEVGNPINIQQGSGQVVEGHKVISQFGTNLRRATCENDYGFTFFDENKIEFVKVAEPLLMAHLLHQEYFDIFKHDKIIDTEVFYDHLKKETNIRIRTEKGNSRLISYNEVMKCFNGEATKFDRDLFIMFNEFVYAPIRKAYTLSEYELVFQETIELEASPNPLPGGGGSNPNPGGDVKEFRKIYFYSTSTDNICQGFALQTVSLYLEGEIGVPGSKFYDILEQYPDTGWYKSGSTAYFWDKDLETFTGDIFECDENSNEGGGLVKGFNNFKDPEDGDGNSSIIVIPGEKDPKPSDPGEGGTVIVNPKDPWNPGGGGGEPHPVPGEGIEQGEPKVIISADLHQLNEGDYLNFFDEQVEMVLGFYVNNQQQIDRVIQYKALAALSDLKYPIKKIFFKSNLDGYDRTIFGSHEWYKIREGKHTVPAINDSDEYYGNSDIRGSWVYVEITMESLNKNKGNILAVINSIRLSYQ